MLPKIRSSAPGGTLDCGEHHRFEVQAGLCARPWKSKKGVNPHPSPKESAATRVPKSCVKAVMLTAVQRLVPPGQPFLRGLNSKANLINTIGTVVKTTAASAVFHPGYTRADLRTNACKDSRTTCSFGT